MDKVTRTARNGMGCKLTALFSQLLTQSDDGTGVSAQPRRGILLHNVKLFVIALAALAIFGANAETVAWWHLNEGANGQRTVNGAATILNAVDSSKLAFKAGVHNSSKALVSGYDQYLPVYTNAFPDYATWLVPGGAKGEDNRGMYFNPSVDNGDSGYGSVLYTEVTDDLRLPSLTVELFVKSDYAAAVPTWRNLIVMGGPGVGDSWALRINQTGTLAFRHFYTQDGGGTANESSTLGGVNALDGKWHHLAFTFDGSTKVLKIYFDYNYSSSKTLTKSLEYVDGRYLEVGSFNQANYGRWHGWVDEVRISDEVLNPADFLRPGKIDEPEESMAPSYPDTVFFASFEKAYDDAFFSSVFPLNEGGGTNTYPATVAINAYPVLENDDLPFENIHAGIMATQTVENTGYWNFVTNSPGLSAMIDVDDLVEQEGGTLAHDFSSGSCTIEMFIRPEASYAHSMYLACQHITGGSGGIMWLLLNNRTLKMELQPDVPGSSRRNNTTTFALSAGEWHHVALVFDRDAQTVAQYVDYNEAGKLTDFLLDASVDTTRYSRYLQLFGGYGHSNNQQMQGAVDGVRLTKHALKPWEFLKKGAVESEPVGRVRAWISFDGDYAVKPRTNDIPAGVASDGTGFGQSVPGILVEDGVGNTLIETNRNSLALPGTVQFPHNVLLDSIDMRTHTLEFYMKFDEIPASDYMTLVRFNEGPSSGGDVVYGVRYRYGNDKLSLRVDTVSSAQKDAVPGHFNQGVEFSDSGLADGKWHHVALTFTPDETVTETYPRGKTTIAFYRDRKYISSGTARGILRTVGGGEISATSLTVGSTGLAGNIDEVRISQGVLSVDEMMHARRPKRGLVVRIR